MRVVLTRTDAAPLFAAGPADLNGAGPGDVIFVSERPDRERDFGRWSGALGSAVLRGASVRRT